MKKDIKWCPKCETEKDVKEFGKDKSRKDGKQTICKECHRNYSKKHHKTNPENYHRLMKTRRDYFYKFIYRFKRRQKCSKCGEKRWYLLEFHHTGDEEKEFGVATMHSRSIKRVKKEIRKCILLCSNCHQEHHYFEKNPEEKPENYIETVA